MDSPTVTHYAGTFIDGTPFDSSYDRGAPATFAPEQVIQGWTEAMQLMVEGDKWELYIPSDLAYGSRGRGSIPGDAALVFTIEMIEIKGDKVPATKATSSSSNAVGTVGDAEGDNKPAETSGGEEPDLKSGASRNALAAGVAVFIIPAFAI